MEGSAKYYFSGRNGYVTIRTGTAFAPDDDDLRAALNVLNEAVAERGTGLEYRFGESGTVTIRFHEGTPGPFAIRKAAQVLGKRLGGGRQHGSAAGSAAPAWVIGSLQCASNVLA